MLTNIAIVEHLAKLTFVHGNARSCSIFKVNHSSKKLSLEPRTKIAGRVSGILVLGTRPELVRSGSSPYPIAPASRLKRYQQTIVVECCRDTLNITQYFMENYIVRSSSSLEPQAPRFLEQFLG